MNAQIKESNQSGDSQRKSPPVSWFGSRRCIFGFLFLACCLVTGVAGAETSSEPPASTNAEVSSSARDARGVETPVVVGIRDSRLRRELWRASINMPEVDENRTDKNELSRIVGQVRSVEFRLQKEASEPVVVGNQIPAGEPNEVPSAKGAQEEVVGKGPEFKPSYEPVSSETLQALENLLQHPDRPVNAFELGDILFLSENIEEAAKFYQKALNRKDEDDVLSASDRAWALFQTGNCLRYGDPPLAKEMYGQMIAGYPDSPWADLAKARNSLIDWYQTDNPSALIEDRILEGPQAGDSEMPPQ
ncbi:MAG: tetratricopeptide repeat protein [Planctomycetota bacterium]